MSYTKWTMYEILADDEAVLQLSTEEWQATEPDEEGQTPEHFEYLLNQIEAMKDEGIRYSEDALNLAFYLRAKELLIEAYEGQRQREIDEAGRYRM